MCDQLLRNTVILVCSYTLTLSGSGNTHGRAHIPCNSCQMAHCVWCKYMCMTANIDRDKSLHNLRKGCTYLKKVAATCCTNITRYVTWSCDIMRHHVTAQGGGVEASEDL